MTNDTSSPGVHGGASSGVGAFVARVLVVTLLATRPQTVASSLTLVSDASMSWAECQSACEDAGMMMACLKEAADDAALVAPGVRRPTSIRERGRRRPR